MGLHPRKRRRHRRERRAACSRGNQLRHVQAPAKRGASVARDPARRGPCVSLGRPARARYDGRESAVHGSTRPPRAKTQAATTLPRARGLAVIRPRSSCWAGSEFQRRRVRGERVREDGRERRSGRGAQESEEATNVRYLHTRRPRDSSWQCIRDARPKCRRRAPNGARRDTQGEQAGRVGGAHGGEENGIRATRVRGDRRGHSGNRDGARGEREIRRVPSGSSSRARGDAGAASASHDAGS